ncbi:hypothetical protein CVT25_010730 [Psilocybe cyanescens]|uniref:Uncharacterized protein n=1 Tax=Psilocybe cyanescens TaxID=93625 RepID=A0A409WJP5_PSICY|nr:hypothetical protein CVT25_010730 [Psilocybe cyanescens]
MVNSSLCSTIAVVQEKARGLGPELRKRLSGQNLVAFANDLSLVAHSIRTGYLLDVFSLQNPVEVFSRLLFDLRSDSRTKDCFASVFHLYEPCSDQSFFVNRVLLAQRIKDYDKPYHSSVSPGNVGLRSIFVHLESTIEIVGFSRCFAYLNRIIKWFIQD